MPCDLARSTLSGSTKGRRVPAKPKKSNPDKPTAPGSQKPKKKKKTSRGK
jgi:hypothetical protein